MTSILTENWPVNYIEQYSFMEEVQKNIANIKARSKQVIIKSLIEPTQRQWEDAYFVYTGQPSPIEVGTKLIWFNLKSGRPKLYTTINDLNGGLNSSGTVYPYIKRNRKTNGFRLIGSIRNGRMVNVFDQLNAYYAVGTSIQDYGVVYLLADAHKWAELQLHSLLILFSFKITSAPANKFLAVSFCAANNSWLDTTGIGTAGYMQEISHTVVFTLGANTWTNMSDSGFIDSTAMVIPTGDFADSGSSLQSEGVMYITGLTWDKNYLTKGYTHPFGSYNAVAFGSASRAVTTGNIRHFSNVIQNYENNPAHLGMPPFCAGSGVGGNPGVPLDTIDSSYFRASIYGLFAGNTPFDLGEF